MVGECFCRGKEARGEDGAGKPKPLAGTVAGLVSFLGMVPQCWDREA